MPAATYPLDPLTQLATRAAFNLQIEELLNHCRAEQQHLALIILDIDHFKSINDAFGHLRGDEALIEVAARLVSRLRIGDYVFRVGGDEFAVLLPGAARREARILAERLLEVVRTTSMSSDLPLTLTISAGVAVFPEDGSLAAELFDRADRRHYQVKRIGRGQVAVDDQPLDTSMVAPARLVERDELISAVQSILQRANQFHRGVLRLSGAQGSGWTRSLAEIRTLAQLIGYRTIAIEGTPARRGRLYGALSRALRAIPDLDRTTLTISHLSGALRSWLTSTGGSLLLITIDDMPDVDNGTLELIQAIFSGAELDHVVLAYASYGPSTLDQLATPELMRDIALTPLSQPGVHTLLRQLLRSEPLEPFVAWLHKQTRGMPGPIWRAIHQLHESGAITFTGSGWTVREQYHEIDLAPALARRAALPPIRMTSQMAEFVGRATELTQIQEGLLQSRLVAIVGPGGIGKTRLAAQAAAEISEQLRDGAIFIELAATTTERVVVRLAEALNLTGATDLRAIAAALHDRQQLLVLDNLEHLTTADQIVQELLDRTNSIQIVTTSRIRTALPQAVVIELSGLDIPSDREDDPILDYEVAQLLIRRVVKMQPQFTLSESDRPHLVRICRLLSGMPLGAELAAAWIASSSCQQVAEQIEGNLMILAAAQPDLAERHRSMLAVVSAFWARLSLAEQQVLRRLGIFQGGFDGQAAMVIAQASPFFLDGLVASGYLRRAPSGRFEIHELLRQYAEEQLSRAPDDRRRTLERFAVHYAGMIEQARDQLIAGGEAIDPLRGEIDNAMAAWRWAAARRRVDILGRIIPGMARYWEINAQAYVAYPLLQQSMRIIRRYLEQRPEDRRALSLIAHTGCRLIWFELLAQWVHYRDVAARIQEVHQWAEQSGDPNALAECLMIHGFAILDNAPATARDLLSKATHLARYPQLIAEIQRLVGILHQEAGEYDQARQVLNQALDAFVTSGDQLGQSRTLTNLVLLSHDQRAVADLERYVAQTMDVALRCGARDCATLVLLVSADISVNRCDIGRATAYLEEAERLLRQIAGNHDLAIAAAVSRSMLHIIAGELDKARATCMATIEAFTAYEVSHMLVHIWVELGFIECSAGDEERALAAFRQAALMRPDDPYARLDLLVADLMCAERHGAASDIPTLLDAILPSFEQPFFRRYPIPLRLLQICWDALHRRGDQRAADVLTRACDIRDRLTADDASPGKTSARMAVVWPMLALIPPRAPTPG